MAIIKLMGGADSSVADLSTVGSSVTISGITVDCAERQADDEVHIEIRSNSGIVAESKTGAYVAVIIIPARRYSDKQSTDSSSNSAISRIADPLDPNAIIVQLWPFTSTAIV